MAPPAWPGITSHRTLILPLAPRDWAPPRAGVLVEGQRFEPKSELHITLVGRRLMQALLQGDKALRRRRQRALREAFQAQDWGWRRSGRLTWLQRRECERGGHADAIVEHIALPAMAPFHAGLGHLLGQALPLPPPHVTLYTRGLPGGIGLPDPATLERLRVRELLPADLHATQ